MVVISKPSSSIILISKLSGSMGHNYYGEPAWPNDILFIFPIVILSQTSFIFGIANTESWSISLISNPFSTPIEILPEWYLFGTFNLLRMLSDKIIGILSILDLVKLLFAISWSVNITIHQNPIHRSCAMFVLPFGIVYIFWLSISL